MPFKNDYIMRIIEQLGAALGRIIFLKGKEKYDEAEEVISHTGQSLLGIDMDLMRRLTDEGIAALLCRPDPSDVGLLLAAAELLREQGEIDDVRGGPDLSYDCYHKSLYLYLECFLHAPETWTEDLAAKTAFLIRRLRPYAVSPSLDRKLAAYYEAQGNYAEAENIVHQLMENGQPDAWEDGLAFYERLLAKSDADLLVGGLPRDEVEDGLAAFKELEE